MNRFSSIFVQILQLFSRHEFFETVNATQAERGAKGFRSSFMWSLSNFVAMLRYNLFTCRDLWVWIDQPFEPLSVTMMPEQLKIHIY